MKKKIISKFKENPKEKATWWAFGLGLTAILSGPLLGFFAAVIRPLLDKIASENTGAAVGIGTAALILSLVVAGFVLAVRAFRHGERSWAMWAGLIPAALAVCFWIFMLIGEFVFPH